MTDYDKYHNQYLTRHSKTREKKPYKNHEIIPISNHIINIIVAYGKVQD